MARIARWSRHPFAGPRRYPSSNPGTVPAFGRRDPYRRAGLFVGASLVGLLLGCGCTAAPSDGGLDKAGGTVTPAPLNLRLANTRGLEDEPFLEQVAKLSNGALTLTADTKLGQPTLTNELDALRAARAGQVDIAIVPSRSFHAFGVTAFDALMDPMLVDSFALQDKVMADSVASDMLHSLDSSGLVGLGLLPGPIRLPNGITRPMLGPATYAGARIATNPSPISEQALRTLGAVPVESTFEGADLTGFDGLEQQASSIAGNQYDGTVRWMTTNVGLWPRPLVIVAGQAAWGRLTDTQRGWLVQAAAGARSDTSYQLGTEDITNMCRRGRITMVSASADEIGQLRRAFGPVHSLLRGDARTAGYLDRIEALKRQLDDAPSGQPIDCAALAKRPIPTQSPGPAASPLGTPVPAGPVSAIDGNYTLLITADELAAAGAAPGEVAPENWGDMRWVFDRGRFGSTQSASTSAGTICTWNYGTYAIHDGPVLELTVLGGGGSRGANKPGELFTYRLSIYRDTMTWSKLASAESPTAWTVKPWQRQPTKPWTQFLDHNCPPPIGWDG
jgi:TRAP-type C4-dicarboxylate transport system substrate-binding protein